jgi:hypothetical protein
MNTEKYIVYILCLAIGSILSCSEMDESMRRFIKDGQTITYAPKVNADSAEAFAGRERIKLSMRALNPRIGSMKISWDNDAKSVTVPVESSGSEGDFEVLLSDMPEKSYSFQIVAYDRLQNSSIAVVVPGNVYGEIYAGALKARVIRDAVFDEQGNLQVMWSGASSGTIGAILRYTDVAGAQHEIYESTRDITEIPGFKPNSNLEYQTVFLPEPTAIDTFYSDMAVRFVEGPRIDISKAGWTATASSYDGRSCCRSPAYAIDENTSTEWVNSIVPQAVFPHTITIDMGEEHPLRGFSFVQRQNTNASLLKDFQVLVSTDSAVWNSMGDYTLLTVKSIQYIDTPEAATARYFRVICKSANDNGKNLGLPEVGAFVR